MSRRVRPVATGPTWAKPYKRPKLTLGPWVIAWGWKWLRQPDGPRAGERWEFTPEQRRFIDWWYAVDERGRFIYRYGMLRRVKGWGKDPIGSVICATEFVGPCRVERVDRKARVPDWPDERPGVTWAEHPAAWVLVAAVAKDQTRNTMTLFPGLFSEELVAEKEIDLGKELIYAHHGKRRLEAVTSSPRALEGPRATFTLKNESQHWLRNNEGHAMAEVIARNATKARDGGSRVLGISNAHEPGEDSDAEHDWEAWQAIEQGRSQAEGFLYDSLEAPPDTDLADEKQLRAGLLAARGDADWLDIDRHVAEIYDPRNSPATSRRFYLNQIVAAEDAWIEPWEYDRLAADQEPVVEDPVLAEGEEVALGFDGSKTDDHAVLRACRIFDGYTVTLGVWDPAEHGGEVPRDQVDGAVRQAFERFRVVAFFSDLHPFESYVDKWAEDLGRELKVKATQRHAIAWDMRARQKDATIEIERLHDEIVEGKFRHDGDKRVRQHFHNARRRPNQWGVTVGKEHRESARKIDGVPATMLARAARRLYLASGKRRRKRTGKAAFV